MDTKKIFTDALFAASDGTPEKEALVCGPEALSFQEYKQLSLKTAGFLAQEKRVAVVMVNGLLTAPVILGSLMAGGQLGLINPNLTAQAIHAWLESFAPTVVFCDTTTAHTVVGGAKKIGAKVVNPVVSQELNQQTPLEISEVKIENSNLLFCGKNDEKKEVSYAELVAVVNEANDNFPVGQGDEVLLTAISHSQKFGLIYGILTPLSRLTKVVVVPQARGSAILKSLQNDQATIFLGGAPQVLHDLMGESLFPGTNFSHLTTTCFYMVIGDEAQDQDDILRKWALATGSSLLEGEN
ncbi:MAG: AMP-binding protein [Alphaproteobacteria bacterium]|nr:AMP-binding protein [Alphaproteobacteria bacterium]